MHIVLQCVSAEDGIEIADNGAHISLLPNALEPGPHGGVEDRIEYESAIGSRESVLRRLTIAICFHCAPPAITKNTYTYTYKIPKYIPV